MSVKFSSQAIKCLKHQDRLYLIALLSLLIADVEVDVVLLPAFLQFLLGFVQAFKGVRVPASIVSNLSETMEYFIFQPSLGMAAKLKLIL